MYIPRFSPQGLRVGFQTCTSCKATAKLFNRDFLKLFQKSSSQHKNGCVILWHGWTNEMTDRAEQWWPWRSESSLKILRSSVGQDKWRKHSSALWALKAAAMRVQRSNTSRTQLWMYTIGPKSWFLNVFLVMVERMTDDLRKLKSCCQGQSRVAQKSSVFCWRPISLSIGWLPTTRNFWSIRRLGSGVVKTSCLNDLKCVHSRRPLLESWAYRFWTEWPNILSTPRSLKSWAAPCLSGLLDTRAPISMSDRHVFSWEDETNSWRSLVCNVLDVIKKRWNLDKHDGSKQQDNSTVSTGSHPWCCGTDILNKVDSHVQNCLNSKCKSCSLCRFGYFVW